MRADDPAAADPARRRLIHKPFPRLPTFPSRPSKISLRPLSPDYSTDVILVHGPDLPPPPRDSDVFRWAILYENQRGITLFSTPFYSPLSLLPSDPYPFTLPNVRRSSPNLSPDSYPLPDATWRWLSSVWMIDMRSDRGHVQHDGFEYNWSFRENYWHANVGNLGAGAWVRRRRWIRLMMHPAVRPSDDPATSSRSRSLSSLPLLRLPSSPALVDSDYISRSWDGTDQDWQHLRRLIKHLGRDGRNLDLWRNWLAPHAIKGKGKQPEASFPSSLEKRLFDPPPLPHIVTILRNHGEAILHSFVFPDSRAHFIQLVQHAGLTEDLESGLGRPLSLADVDFCSYANTD